MKLRNRISKICSKCKIDKTLNEYSKDKQKSDGLSCACKDCSRLDAKRKYLENKEYYYRRNHNLTDEQKSRRRLREKNLSPEQRHRKTQYNIQYIKSRYHSDEKFNLSVKIRTRMNKALLGKNKSRPTMQLLGCSIEKLRKHLESQFQEGMNWDNHDYYGWHVDHIRPIASFDLTDPKQQAECFHYTNLQPLWMKDNLMKADNIG